MSPRKKDWGRGPHTVVEALLSNATYRDHSGLLQPAIGSVSRGKAGCPGLAAERRKLGGPGRLGGRSQPGHRCGLAGYLCGYRMAGSPVGLLGHLRSLGGSANRSGMMVRLSRRGGLHAHCGVRRARPPLPRPASQRAAVVRQRRPVRLRPAGRRSDPPRPAPVAAHCPSRSPGPLRESSGDR